MTLIAPADPAASGDIDLDIVLAKIAAGDADALDALRARLAPVMLDLLTRMLPDRDVRERVVEEVFAEVWMRSQEGAAPQFSAEPWVLAIAHRKASEAAS